MFGEKPGLARVRGRYTQMVADLVPKEAGGQASTPSLLGAGTSLLVQLRVGSASL